MKKEDNRIRNARIWEDILQEYIDTNNVNFDKIANEYNVLVHYIFEQIKMLKDEGFLEVYIPPCGSLVITGITNKGLSYIECRFVEKAKKDVRIEKEIERRAKRAHKVNGFRLFKYWKEIIIGLTYPTIDIFVTIISGKGVIEIIRSVF